MLIMSSVNQNATIRIMLQTDQQKAATTPRMRLRTQNAAINKNNRINVIRTTKVLNLNRRHIATGTLSTKISPLRIPQYLIGASKNLRRDIIRIINRMRRTGYSNLLISHLKHQTNTIPNTSRHQTLHLIMPNRQMLPINPAITNNLLANLMPVNTIHITMNINIITRRLITINHKTIRPHQIYTRIRHLKHRRFKQIRKPSINIVIIRHYRQLPSRSLTQHNVRSRTMRSIINIRSLRLPHRPIAINLNRGNRLHQFNMHRMNNFLLKTNQAILSKKRHIVTTSIITNYRRDLVNTRHQIYNKRQRVPSQQTTSVSRAPILNRISARMTIRQLSTISLLHRHRINSAISQNMQLTRLRTHSIVSIRARNATVHVRMLRRSINKHHIKYYNRRSINSSRRHQHSHRQIYISRPLPTRFTIRALDLTKHSLARFLPNSSVNIKRRLPTQIVRNCNLTNNRRAGCANERRRGARA